MSETYATVDEYRTDSGDTASPDGRVDAMLLQQSAKLRALAGITAGMTLTDDQLAMCRMLVTDSVRKALAPQVMAGIGANISGATQASWSANGFSASTTFANPSGSAYFDRDTLRALRRSLGTSQSAGTVIPSFGALL